MSASSQGRFATGSDGTADIERGRRRATRRHSHGRVCVSSAVHDWKTGLSHALNTVFEHVKVSER